MEHFTQYAVRRDEANRVPNQGHPWFPQWWQWVQEHVKTDADARELAMALQNSKFGMEQWAAENRADAPATTGAIPRSRLGG